MVNRFKSGGNVKIKTKKVYYCDFCKKHGLKTIAIHEKHCTANPNRECRLCGRKEPITDIVKKYLEQTATPLLDDIKNEFDYHCPACVLSIIRQAELNTFKNGKGVEFNYEEEMKKWWDEKNREEMDRETYGM